MTRKVFLLYSSNYYEFWCKPFCVHCNICVGGLVGGCVCVRVCACVCVCVYVYLFACMCEFVPSCVFLSIISFQFISKLHMAFHFLRENDTYRMLYRGSSLLIFFVFPFTFFFISFFYTFNIFKPQSLKRY